jgi:hypothetical protein
MARMSKKPIVIFSVVMIVLWECSGEKGLHDTTISFWRKDQHAVCLGPGAPEYRGFSSKRYGLAHGIGKIAGSPRAGVKEGEQRRARSQGSEQDRHRYQTSSPNTAFQAISLKGSTNKVRTEVESD